MRTGPSLRIHMLFEFHLAQILEKENVSDASGAVDSMMKRFLRVPISGERRAEIVQFCEKQMGGSKIDYHRYTLEKELREVLHLILSAPEYQVSWAAVGAKAIVVCFPR